MAPPDLFLQYNQDVNEIESGKSQELTQISVLIFLKLVLSDC